MTTMETAYPSTEETASSRTAVTELSAEQRHAQMCGELGKMAPIGSVVVDFKVESGQSFCSPVKGKIWAVLQTADGTELGQRRLHTTEFREQPTDPKGLFSYLNDLANLDKAYRPAKEPTWHRDT